MELEQGRRYPSLVAGHMRQLGVERGNLQVSVRGVSTRDQYEDRPSREMWAGLAWYIAIAYLISLPLGQGYWRYVPGEGGWCP